MSQALFQALGKISKEVRSLIDDMILLGVEGMTKDNK